MKPVVKSTREEVGRVIITSPCCAAHHPLMTRLRSPRQPRQICTLKRRTFITENKPSYKRRNLDFNDSYECVLFTVLYSG